MIIIQLQTLSGVAKGLTRTADSLFFDESPTEQLETGRMARAREDPRMVRLRDSMLSAIGTTLEYWSTDASVSDVRSTFPQNYHQLNDLVVYVMQAMSDLVKSITALPLDITLITLPAGPLLERICRASQRQLTAVWLTLAGMLIVQLAKPTLDMSTLKFIHNPEAQGILSHALPILLEASLNTLGQPGAMEAVSLFAPF